MKKKFFNFGYHFSRSEGFKLKVKRNSYLSIHMNFINSNYEY